MVVVDLPQEVSQLPDGSGAREVLNNCHLLGEGLQACSTQPVAQEIHGRDTKNTLSGVQFESIFLMVAKDLLQMVCMLLR